MHGLRNEAFTSEAERARLSAEFTAKHCVLISNLLHPELLAVIQRGLAAAPFESFSHGALGQELITTDRVLLSALHFVANIPSFLEAVRRITGLPAITFFAGRLYRMLPSPEHWDEWHNDRVDGRLVGMSVNLTPELYSGGVFKLRRADTREMLRKVANTGFGDANLFRISKELEHHVTAVTGTVPRTAFAGWFLGGQPDLYSLFKQNRAPDIP
jgi:hypothetical protein